MCNGIIILVLSGIGIISGQQTPFQQIIQQQASQGSGSLMRLSADACPELATYMGVTE